MIDYKTLLTEAIGALEKYKARVEKQAEPIAIVGCSSRIPSQHDLWPLLRDGSDGPKEFGPGRICSPTSIGKYKASLLDDVESFDPFVFGISSPEARVMDPQQRMVLETALEALCSSGLAKSYYARAGVFLGATHSGYREGRELPPEVGPFVVTGELIGTVAGRVSYAFGFNGPAITTETACSSSLVTIHQACDALRLDQCDVALAGGVNFISSDRGFVSMETVSATSEDGRCKTFDASADGFGRGEGCGILVLKRLSNAQVDGDHILGLVRGAALNQDGRSASISAPNVLAQQDVIRLALSAARVAPADVQYVEAHGTGTRLGDPIEIEALAAAYGVGRNAATPLLVGSIKTNIGHLEYAAGVAGVLKVLLAIRHRKLPPSLHFKNPNPHIPWDTIPIKVQTELSPWPEPSKALIAGISAFGITGTNAHVIVSEPPAEPEEKWAAADAEASRKDLLLPLAISAKVPKALREYAERFLALLEAPEDETYYTTWRDIAHTSAVRWQHMEERLVVVGRSKDEWKTKLRAFLQGEETVPGLAKGNGKETKNRVVFVFPGQGAQWLGMGKSLLQNNAAFKAEISLIEKAFSKHVDWKLTEELLNPKQERFEKLDIIQPLLFAMAAGIAASLKALGVEPSAVLGHSQGEVAAAYVAGGLSLEDAALIICLRSRLVEKTRGSGHMLVTGLSMAEADAEIVRFDGAISIAASNGPSTTILSGDATAVETLAAELEKKSVFVRLLKVGYASHSRQMEPLKEELLKGLSSLSPKTPEKRFASTALPDTKDAPSLGANYWWQNLRNPVRFYDRVKALSEEGYDLFLEISPHPGLTSSIQDAFLALNATGSQACASLRKNEDENLGLLETFAVLHSLGYNVDWKKAFQNKDGNYIWGRVAELPSYPWQRQRYWLPEKKEKKAHESKWPFIHSHTESASHQGEHIFQVELDLADDNYAYLKDHKVQGVVWFPGAGYIEMALEVGTELLGANFSGVTSLVLKESLILSDAEPTLLQLTTSAPNDNNPEHKGAHPFTIASKPKNDKTAAWALHATGLLETERLTPGDMPRLQDVRNRIKQLGSEDVGAQTIYTSFEELDLSYGPAFQGLVSVSPGKEETLAKLRTPEALSHPSLAAYRAHPSILDAAFQASFGATAALKKEQTFVPASVEHIRSVQSTGNIAAQAFVKVRSSDASNLSLDIYLLDKDGKLLTEVIGLGLKPIRQAQDKLDKWMWDVAWKAVPQGTSDDLQGPWLLLEDAGTTGKELKSLLEKRNQKVVSLPASTSDAEIMHRFLVDNFPKVPPKKIVHLAALDVPAGLTFEASTGGESACLSLLSILQGIQKLQASHWTTSPKLIIVTRGAQPPVLAPAQAMLWGFGVCISKEMPELESTLVDVSPNFSPEDLLSELTHRDGEREIALRSTKHGIERTVRHLVRHPRSVSEAPYVFPTDRTALITGGFGGLGPVIARKLAELGCKHIALVGRTGASVDTQRELDSISRELGATFYSLRCDISNASDVDSLTHQLATLNAPSVHTLVHAAVALRDGTIQNQTAEAFRHVFRPKVDGTLNLLGKLLPERVIYFSSAAGLIGNGGQTNYGAASAFLDAAAHFQSAQRDLSAIAIDWGAWSDVGAAAKDLVAQNMKRQGMVTISPRDGSTLFARMIASHRAQVGLGLAAPTEKAMGTNHLTSKEDCGRYLATLFATHLGQATISRSTPFKLLGIDSLGYVAIRNKLMVEIGRQLTVATIMSAGTIDSLAELLVPTVEESTTAQPISPPAASPPPPGSTGDHADVRKRNNERRTRWGI